jgi:hypothetical protein
VVLTITDFNHIYVEAPEFVIRGILYRATFHFFRKLESPEFDLIDPHDTSAINACDSYKRHQHLYMSRINDYTDVSSPAKDKAMELMTLTVNKFASLNRLMFWEAEVDSMEEKLVKANEEWEKANQVLKEKVNAIDEARYSLRNARIQMEQFKVICEVNKE